MIRCFSIENTGVKRLSLFENFNNSSAIRASEVVRTRNSHPLTLTITKQRITVSISTDHLEKSGISIEGKSDVVFSDDGKVVMIEEMKDGLKISSKKEGVSRGKNVAIRLTNKDVYPDFISAHKEDESEVSRIVLVSDKVEYDKGGKRMICSLRRK